MGTVQTLFCLEFEASDDVWFMVPCGPDGAVDVASLTDTQRALYAACLTGIVDGFVVQPRGVVERVRR